MNLFYLILKIPRYLMIFISHAQMLNFKEKPDYELLRKCLIDTHSSIWKEYQMVSKIKTFLPNSLVVKILNRKNNSVIK